MRKPVYLTHPDVVGEAEYRAVYDLLVEAEAVARDGHEERGGKVIDFELAGAIIDQFDDAVEDIARAIGARA